MKKKIYTICIICILIALVFMYVFVYKHNPFDFSQPALTDVLGQYGDFVGGVIGTVCAFISVYLLWKTLDNQNDVNKSIKKTNESVIETNNKLLESNSKTIEQTSLMIFDNKFRSFLTTYHNAIDSYRYKNHTGRDAFEKMVEDFKQCPFVNNLTYSLRTKAAVEEFKSQLYADNRAYLSVHLRTLYLLMQLISEDKMLTEDQRAVYAKCIRGQLTDNEMLVIRYNCFTAYGENMQQYVNEFNLLKHLPPMSLLEFSRYRTLISSNIEELNAIDAVDALLLEIRHTIVHSFNHSKNSRVHNEITVSPRLNCKITISEDRKDYDFILEFNRQRGPVGNIKKPDVEKALLLLPNEDLRLFIFDFHHELFFSSNFSLYNEKINETYPNAIVSDYKVRESGDTVTVTCKIQRDEPLILKYDDYVRIVRTTNTQI